MANGPAIERRQQPYENIRILVVEDNTGDARLIRENLRSFNGDAAVMLELTLVAAISRLGQGNIDVVLLDLKLADSEGVDTLRRLRHVDAIVPIIVLTGNSDPDMAGEAMVAGATDYLMKEAMTPARLCQKVLDVVRTRKEQNSLEELRRRLVKLAARLDQRTIRIDRSLQRLAGNVNALQQQDIRGRWAFRGALVVAVLGLIGTLTGWFIKR